MNLKQRKDFSVYSEWQSIRMVNIDTTQCVNIFIIYVAVYFLFQLIFVFPLFQIH